MTPAFSTTGSSAAAGSTGEGVPARACPGPREMALVGGLAFFLTAFSGTLLQLVHARAGFVLSQTLFIVLPVLLAVRWFYLDRSQVLPFGRPRPGALAGALLGAAGLNHLLTLYGAWQESVVPTPEPIRALFEGLFTYRGPADFAVLLVVYSLVPAVCEEILFRGFLQTGLVHHLGSPARGIAVSAFVFGLFHLNPWRFAGVFCLGLFLGWLRHESGSLVVSIAAHLFSNLISIVLLALGRPEATAGGPRTLIAVVAVAAAIALVRLARAPAGRVL
jgi:membrane protease YdiL (CAAX protease family)